MMKQMRTLLRVKQMKHDEALREMQIRRKRVEEAGEVTRQAEKTLEESRRSYGAREDAIYARILGAVIDPGQVDETRARIVGLEKDHTRLVDALERARHVQARLERELEEATTKYFSALRARDKFTMINQELLREAEVAAEYREDVENEDRFCRPRERAA